MNNITFDDILELIQNGCNVFITGGAGTGKSYTLNKLKEIYKDELHITSTTGISAINVNGQTIHSWAGIGIANKPIDEIVKSIKQKPNLYMTLLCCKMLAIDEISMLDSRAFEYVSEVLKRIRKLDKPFGGIQVIVIGDFYQLPPVKTSGNEKDFCFKSKTWTDLDLIPIVLTEVKRQTEKDLSEALNNIRLGKTNPHDIELFYKCNVKSDYALPKDVLQIFGTNIEADTYNIKCYNEIQNKPYTYESKDELFIYKEKSKDLINVINLKDTTEQTLNKYDLIALKRFDEDCKAPKILSLKAGCRVILLQNLNVKKGLANGSCGTVLELTNDYIKITFDNGVTTNIEPTEFEYIKEGLTKIRRTQYPLRLAYGITIHRSQGMTFDKLIVNFNRIFDYGQAYVALSRTRTAEGLIIKDFNPQKIIANKEVIEFYEEISQ